MPAIASLEDLKAAQKDLQEAKDLVFWRDAHPLFHGPYVVREYRHKGHSGGLLLGSIIKR